ncbi:MAG: hypothetical protein GXX84_10590 [Acidobacteria bacterium]|nr:hypothetical protein [Acidobacteriota bacterium]
MSELNLTIKLPSDLSSFLRNPREGMMRMIYSRLFELVQGKTTEDDFEWTARNDLVSGATDLFRIGYETWSALSLIILLEPDAFYGLALDGADRFVATDIEEISFGRQFHHPAKRIPEFILHSKRMDRLIAFKMPLTREVNSYYVPVEVPTQRLLRNRNGDSSDALDRRMIFLSVVPDLEKTPVFADIHKRTVNGPDLTVECLSEQDLSSAETIGQIQNRLEIMKPRLGAAMVLTDSKPKSESLPMIQSVDIFSVGLKQSGFQLILDKLA